MNPPIFLRHMTDASGSSLQRSVPSTHSTQRCVYLLEKNSRTHACIRTHTRTRVHIITQSSYIIYIFSPLPSSFAAIFPCHFKACRERIPARRRPALFYQSSYLPCFSCWPYLVRTAATFFLSTVFITFLYRTTAYCSGKSMETEYSGDRMGISATASSAGSAISLLLSETGDVSSEAFCLKPNLVNIKVCQHFLYPACKCRLTFLKGLASFWNKEDQNT